MIATGIALASAAGCWNRDNAQPLSPDAFVARRVEGRSDPAPIDTPGQVVVDGVKPPGDERVVDTRDLNEISPAVRQSVRAPGENEKTVGDGGKASSPTTHAVAPEAQPQKVAEPVPGAVDPSGQYVVFGTVLAEVNNRPIYAHKLLGILDNALRAEAQRYDARAFRPVAAKLIADEIRNQQRNELVFAVAEKSLEAREKQAAKSMTEQWQNDEVTKAGGSLELAKRRWADEGWDFNDRLDYQYRVSMTRMFYQRRVFPLVHVTAYDIRHYYETRKDAEYTRPARAKFRVIKIDAKTLKLAGGDAEAKRLADEIHAKAFDADFESLARATNDPVLQASAGLVPGNAEGWLPKGTYVAEAVENAVWALKPGQVTDVVKEKGAYYVAKLEDKQDAVARAFEEPAVQASIEETLRAQQFKELQDRFQNKLIREAAVQEHPQMMRVALDMAMQRYASWASADGAKQ